MDYLLNKQLLILTAILLVVGLIMSFQNSSFHLPGNQQDYQPKQPIAFSHQLHAGEMEISCQYCHYGAEDSRHAGIPSVNVCMNCHKFVNTTMNEIRLSEKEKRPAVNSKEILKIYQSLGMNGSGSPVNEKKPVEWIKVHNLPDYVFFSHKPHINAGVDCSQCHGKVSEMSRVKQENDLSMGWCLNCHRDAHSTMSTAPGRTAQLQDCSACHY